MVAALVYPTTPDFWTPALKEPALALVGHALRRLHAPPRRTNTGERPADGGYPPTSTQSTLANTAATNCGCMDKHEERAKCAKSYCSCTMWPPSARLSTTMVRLLLQIFFRIFSWLVPLSLPFHLFLPKHKVRWKLGNRDGI